MKRAFLFGTTAATLLFATALSASAQSVLAPSPTTPTAAAQPVAGGAAGHMPYLTYAWENTMARLGFGSSDESSKAAPTRTASADTH
jgi:hypothetical protein